MASGNDASWLTLPKLAGRSSLRHYSASADNEAHRRIASKPVGVVDIFASAQASEDRLTKLRN
jgi:hypothetical protein